MRVGLFILGDFQLFSCYNIYFDSIEILKQVLHFFFLFRFVLGLRRVSLLNCFSKCEKNPGWMKSSLLVNYHQLMVLLSFMRLFTDFSVCKACLQLSQLIHCFLLAVLLVFAQWILKH